MNSQIIYLEADDSLPTIQDKINWSKSERILLIYPNYSPPLNKKIDLVRLQRISQKNGAQLAIVTNNIGIRNIAKDIGVSVFSNITKANLSDWKTPKAKIEDIKFHFSSRIDKKELKGRSQVSLYPSWFENKYFRIFTFSVALIAVFSLLIFFIF